MITFYNILQRLFFNNLYLGGGGSGGGGSSPAPQPAPTPSAPSIPKPPSLGAQIKSYIKAIPDLYKASKKYDPKFADLQLALFQQFAPLFTDFYQSEMQRLVPYSYGLQEQLAKQATEGMNSELPAQLRADYLNTLRSELGANAGSPIGAEYLSRNMANLGEGYRSYYRALAQDIMGRVPAPQPFLPPLTSVSGDFNAGTALNYGSQTYGAYAGAQAALSSAIASRPTQYAPQQQRSSGGGGFWSGVGGALLSPFGCWVASAIYGGWLKPNTKAARLYMGFLAPNWLKMAYLKHGYRLGKVVKKYPILGAILRPLFNFFGNEARRVFDGI